MSNSPNSTGAAGAASAETLRIAKIAPPVLKQYWSVMVRRRWLGVAIVGVTALVGLVVTMFMRPLYMSTATIEISRQENQVVKVDGVNPSAAVDDREFYQTQYSLLVAHTLADTVVQKLRLYDDRAFFAAFNVDPASTNFFGKKAIGSPEAQRAKRYEAAVELLRENIIIEPIRNSRLVAVSFLSGDPAQSQRIANAWAEGFLQSNLARRYTAASYARSFLEGRLNQLRQRLQASERRAVAFAEANKILNVTAQETSGANQSRVERSLESDNLVTLNEALAQAQTDRVRAQSRLQSDGAGGAEGASNPLLSSLRQRRAEAAAEYAKLIVQFDPVYPAAKALADQVASFDRAIAAERRRVNDGLVNAVREATAREASLSAQVEGLKKGVLDLRSRSIQYNIYERDVDTNRQLYDGLLQRFKEIGIASGVGISNVIIVDGARLPKEPSSPRWALNLLLAMATGIAIAGLVIFILEQIDEQIKDPLEVEDATGLPFLGVIPKVDGNPLQLLQDRRSTITDAYVALQAVLQLSTDHGVPRSLAVTSTMKGEGKSTTTYVIAQLLARAGRRVIVVDADMRAPTISKQAAIPNRQGVSNFLSGDDDIGRLIIPDDGHGVALMLAGPMPPNAAELLIGSRLPLLIEKLRGHYDHVIIDSPPVLGLADAPLIGHATEAVLFVSEANGARVNAIRIALQRLFTGGSTIIGIVLTKFDPKLTGYGYGYGYGYNYDYSHKAAEGSAS